MKWSLRFIVFGLRAFFRASLGLLGLKKTVFLIQENDKLSRENYPLLTILGETPYEKGYACFGGFMLSRTSIYVICRGRPHVVAGRFQCRRSKAQ